MVGSWWQLLHTIAVQVAQCVVVVPAAEGFLCACLPRTTHSYVRETQILAGTSWSLSLLLLLCPPT